ncbi:methyl-accepting chemotaxis protein [Undibacterium sp. TJN25]|uniref:methyl-accepting chemotaxis protein n=1 Tax=Undibacterium sp. TJN25 TaxID=3413056 RepID=UPI003BF1FCDA
MKLTDMTIGKRLGGGFAALLVLMAAMAVISVMRLQSVGNATEAMVRDALVKERLASEWMKIIEGNSIRTLSRIKSDDPETQKFFAQQIAGQSVRANEIYKQLESTTPQGNKHILQVQAQLENYKSVRDAVLKLKTAGDEAATKEATEKRLIPAMQQYNDAVLDFVNSQKDFINTSAAEIDASYRSGRIFLIALAVAALLVGAVLALLLSRSIVRPLARAVDVARAVAAGDLSTTITLSGKDETGQLLEALKEMNQNLFETVSQVRSGAASIATASSEIASGNLDLSTRTEEQASSLQETASAMEQLSSTVRQNADNARQANQLAMTASSVASDGGKVVSQVVDTMNSINDSSGKIVDIISVINSIAFQTNILALNAAVEAARAGEQGRGFAVVASEVRNLAQRSAAAAKEIKTLIDDSVEKVQVGSRLVDDAGITMEKIVASVRRVTDIVGEISAASQEQSTGIEEVSRAVIQMDKVTQQNAALVEQAAVAAHSLQDQAANLEQTVSLFQLGHRVAAQPAFSGRASGADALRTVLPAKPVSRLRIG